MLFHLFHAVYLQRVPLGCIILGWVLDWRLRGMLQANDPNLACKKLLQETQYVQVSCSSMLYIFSESPWTPDFWQGP